MTVNPDTPGVWRELCVHALRLMVTRFLATLPEFQANNPCRNQ